LPLSLKEQVQLVFDQATHAETPYLAEDLTSEALSAMKAANYPPFVWTGTLPHLQLEQVHVLRAMYARCAAPEREAFQQLAVKPYLNEWVERDIRIAQTIAHVIVEMGALQLLEGVTFAADPRWRAYRNLWHSIRVKLSFEPHRFSDSDLDELLTLVKGMREKLPKGPPHIESRPDWRPVATEAEPVNQPLRAIEATVKRLRYLRLTHELQVLSLPEVDHDQQLLLSRLQSLGFSPDFEAAIHEVDHQIRMAVKGFDFKRCIELLRTFFERFVEDTAERVSVIHGNPMPQNTGPRSFKNCNERLHSLKFFSKEEFELTQKLMNLLAVEGSHTLSSAPEQARVARTTVIEWSMLIAGRLQRLS
jgi:hypothetical protein